MRWWVWLLGAPSSVGGCTLLFPFEGEDRPGALDCLSAEEEGNDSPGEAGELCLGTPVTGQIAPGNDLDWFVVQLEAGQEVVFTTSGSCEGEDSEGVDTVLFLYARVEDVPTLDREEHYQLCDHEGHVACNDEGDPPGHCSVMELTPGTTGRFYLLVLDYRETSTGTYTLSVRKR